MELSENFKWTEFYMAFATKLLEYRNDRDNLITKIERVYESIDMKLPKIEKDGTIIDIDPFTILGFYNKRITNNNRRSIVEGLIQEFSVDTEVPEHFAGIPVLSPQNANFFSFKEYREEDDIDILWDVFDSALVLADSDTNDNRKRFCEDYDIAQQIPGVKWNLTMALYWARPYFYLNMDSTNRNYIVNCEEIPVSKDDLKKAPTGEQYLELRDKCMEVINSGKVNYHSFPELSYKAWSETESTSDEADEEWFPSDYDPGFSVDDWLDILNDSELFTPNCLEIMKRMKDIGGQATCTQLAQKYGETKNFYNAGSSSLAKRIAKKTKCPIMERDTDNSRWWPILYVGRDADDDEVGSYVWKLRNELSQALDMVDLSEVKLYAEKKRSGSMGINKIFYGAPGCGKSYYIQSNLKRVGVSNENIVRVTFHPEYSNTDFVGQIMPTIVKTSNEDKVTYRFKPGAFTIALQKAYSTDEDVYLIIEEINRGNAAAIFGDMFQLLDRIPAGEENEGESAYPIFNPNMQQYLMENTEDEDICNKLESGIFIPSNLFIYATMNTSDQNVFTLDTAFKRRWSFRQISNTFTSEHPYKDYYIPGTAVTWERFLNKLNTEILDSSIYNSTNEDKRLGVYFVSRDMLCETIETDNIDSANAEQFAYKVLEYLWNDVCRIGRDDWFDTDKYKTLEDLIDGFLNLDEPLSIFKNIDFGESTGDEE